MVGLWLPGIAGIAWILAECERHTFATALRLSILQIALVQKLEED